MKYLKITTTKTKGFTLIELMVVISIIALLSSVVLASIISVREKAQITKTVGEIKSLQNALELFRGNKGYYPGVVLNSIEGLNYDDDVNCNYICGFSYGGNIDTLLQAEMVNNKFLSNVAHAPNYPNNCGPDCDTRGYVLGYAITDPVTGYTFSQSNDPNYYFLCGGQKIKNYFIYFYANNKKVNLPLLSSYDNGNLFNPITYDENELNPPYIYCLSM